MAPPDFASVDDYLAAQPPAAQRVLRRVRTVVRKALPQAEETIAYKIPTYKLPGGTVIHFAGWKDHLSLYPATSAVVAAAREAREKVEVEKGTVRIPYKATLPVHLISLIARTRAQEVAAEAKRTKKPPKRSLGQAPKRAPQQTLTSPSANSPATKSSAAKKSRKTAMSTAKTSRGKSATQKPAAQKHAAQKHAAKKPAAQKHAAQKPAAKKHAAQKQAAKRPADKKR